MARRTGEGWSIAGCDAALRLDDCVDQKPRNLNLLMDLTLIRGIWPSPAPQGQRAAPLGITSSLPSAIRVPLTGPFDHAETPWTAGHGAGFGDSGGATPGCVRRGRQNRLNRESSNGFVPASSAP